MTRTRARASILLAVAALLAAACGGGQPAGAPSAATAAAEDDPAWKALVADAQKEGKVVVSGPPTTETRQNLPAAFKERFGIDMEYIALGSTADLLVKIEAERKAGLYTLDALLGGAQSLYTVAYPNGFLDPIKPVLINKEAADGSKWVGGKVWFMDPKGDTILRCGNYATTLIVVNTKYYDAARIKSWKDLLVPELKGKIAAFDPVRAGTGWETSNYLWKTFGDDFVKKLYVEQQPGISGEPAQLADWNAQGRYPVTIALRADQIERLRIDGFPIVVVSGLPDAPGVTTSGSGLLGMLNKAPHPKAAAVFANWMAMREGQEVWHRSQKSLGVRIDVDYTKFAPEYAYPKPGLSYFDAYGWDYTLDSRNPKELDKLKKVLGK
jgi:iron(III) transport system substrate-binding protein